MRVLLSFHNHHLFTKKFIFLKKYLNIAKYGVNPFYFNVELVF
jgi:hypothetical protein